jgi:formate hydrogenlyase subunit 3/multisubunit Na+/H+ antiporter MnhD subunit
MKRFEKVLPHISIILSAMVIIFYIIDQFNNSMALLEDQVTKVLILFLGICSLATAILFILMQRQAEKKRRMLDR